MKIYTVNFNDKNKIAIKAKNNKFYLLDELGVLCSSMNDFIDIYSDEIKEQIEDALTNKNINNYNSNEVKILAPIIRTKQDIICLGVNYYDHINKVEFEDGVNKKRDDKVIESYMQPSNTIYFSKRVNEAVGQEGIIQLHDDIVSQLDYEAELAVILKKDAYKVKAEEAYDYIFGYSVINDISARDLQARHTQWYRGKSLDGFTAMGPCIVTADEVEDVQNLNITCTVNGELRQNSNTKLMIQSVSKAIEELSAGMTLLAGTVIATGTPGGIGKSMNPPRFLKKGDVVECQIEHIGCLKNVIG